MPRDAHFLGQKLLFIHPDDTLGYVEVAPGFHESGWPYSSFPSGLSVVFRLNNLADKLIAERADFGSGDYRYLPGRGRELFVEVRYFPLW